MTTNLRQTILDTGDLPEEILLGRLVLFTITDEPTRRDQLVAWFDELGLNKDLLPAEIKPIDAFKKATSEAKDKYELPTGETAVVLCRDVDSNPAYIKRQITREVRNTRQQQLSYNRAIECTFYRGQSGSTTDANGNATSRVRRGSERFHIRVDKAGLTEGELRAVQDIARGIKARYEHYYDHFDGNRLRATVRDYIKYLNAVEIKAGCYFVHVSRSAELRALQTLVERLGGGCFMHTIPLVDLEEQRKMVTTAFTREAADDLADLTRDARTLAAGGKVTSEAYARIKSRYDQILAKADEHMTGLQLGQDITGAAAQTALDALRAVQEGVLS